MDIPDFLNPFSVHRERRKKNVELTRIYKKDKREAVEAVLFNPSPGHYDRLWMVGFLFYVGYLPMEVCDLIHDLNEWDRYSEQMTYHQVMSIAKTYKGKKRRGWGLPNKEDASKLPD